MRAQAFILALIAVSCVSAEPPAGWHKSGSEPNAYEVEFDSGEQHEGKSSGSIRSVGAVQENGFGTLMQTVRADDYRGQKVRLSAFTQESFYGLESMTCNAEVLPVVLHSHLPGSG